MFVGCYQTLANPVFSRRRQGGGDIGEFLFRNACGVCFVTRGSVRLCLFAAGQSKITFCCVRQELYCIMWKGHM